MPTRFESFRSRIDQVFMPSPQFIDREELALAEEVENQLDPRKIRNTSIKKIPKFSELTLKQWLKTCYYFERCIGDELNFSVKENKEKLKKEIDIENKTLNYGLDEKKRLFIRKKIYDYKKQLKELKIPNEESKLPFEKQYESLSKIKGLNRVVIKNNVFYLFTDFIKVKLKSIKKTELIDIGRMVVEIRLKNKNIGLRAINLDYQAGDKDHLCVKSENVCVGEYDEVFKVNLMECNFVSLFRNFIYFLSEDHFKNPYIHLEDWKKSKVNIENGNLKWFENNNYYWIKFYNHNLDIAIMLDNYIPINNGYVTVTRASLQMEENNMLIPGSIGEFSTAAGITSATAGTSTTVGIWGRTA